MVEQGTADKSSTARYALWVLVYALECSSIVSFIVSHEVAIVFESPGGGTLGFGREHQHRVSTRGSTHYTRRIMIGNRCQGTWGLIFCPIDRASFLDSRCELQIVWGFWQAEVISSSPLGIIMSPSSSVPGMSGQVVRPQRVYTTPPLLGPGGPRWPRSPLSPLSPFSPSLPSLPGTPSRPSRPS